MNQTGGYGREKALTHQCSMVESFEKVFFALSKHDANGWMKSRVFQLEINVSSRLNRWTF